MTAVVEDAHDPVPADELALADELFEAVSLLRRRARRAAGRPFAGLTDAQVELVRLVRRRPGISVTDAAGELGLAANTVSTLVRALREKDVLTRANDPGDRRVVRLALTPEALAAVLRWRAQRSTVAIEALGALDRADRTTLAAALPAMTRLAHLMRPDPVDAQP